jgi:Domain of unknown function (DUF1843)
MADDQHAAGPLPPYGPAIWDAVKRGDLAEMEHIADQARHAIARGAQAEGVEITQTTGHFRDVAAHEVVEVREALTNLEQKICELRASQANPAEQTQRPQAEPRVDPDAPPQAAQTPPQ